MSRRSLRVMQSRSCGPCTACCGPGLRVDETSKPHRESCQYRTDAGCGIYTTRPEPCRAAKCAWLNRDGPMFTGAARPDRIGVFAFGEDTERYGPVLVVYEAWSGAAESPAAKLLIDDIARTGTLVIVRDSVGKETLHGYRAVGAR